MSIYHLRRRKRLIFAFFVFALFFLVLAIRLTSIQAFDSINLTDEQINQLMGEIPLTATRGDIYDRNMNILAKDASASAIYVRPKDVKEPEEIADYLSEVLELDREKLYKKITDKTQWIALIERKVDNDIAFDIRNKKFKGVEISEDKKRYYTNGNFASYVLGFTGTDHQGLYGVESVLNNVLSGEDGVLVYEKDGLSQKVASGYQVRIEPNEGDNVVLTIDSIIQHFLESQLEKTMDEFDAKRVIAIALDPNTGEILAMSSKPDYNLNDPRTVSELFEDKMSTELEGMNLGQKQLEMWKNPAVTFNYEPGSTFKPITAAAALEEGVVSAETSFFDKGYIMIDGQRIKCHIFPRSHGAQSFIEAVANSCNPVLVETAMRMEPVTFYKYIYNFGFGDQTRIQLDGEQAGIVPNNNDRLINYVPKSYGQGISVTPIQLINALSAIVNNGKYMQANIVKYILSSDNNEIIKEYKPEQIRQVVSEDTASTVQDILNLVVSNSENLSSMSTYKVGGKTGTAQKIINGAYAKGLYITSFFGYAPVDDPKIAILYIVDEPKGYGVYGSNTAAPHAMEFINNTLDYLNVPGGKGESLKDSSIVPDLRNQELDLAKEVLNYLKLEYEISGEVQSGYIVNQDPMPGELITEDTVITLTLGEEITQKEEVVTVPNVIDMTVQQANETLSRVGLKLAITGSGGVSTQQSPLAGEQVQKGSEVVVEFKPLE